MSYKLCTIKRDALDELVKCKTSKTIFQLKFTKMSDISGLLDSREVFRTCPSLKLDMSGPHFFLSG
jgi:hypothetical protein